MVPRSVGLAILGSVLAASPAGAALRPEPFGPAPVESARNALRAPPAAHAETRRALLLRTDDPIQSRTTKEPAADSWMALILWLLALSAAAGSLAAGYARLALPAKAIEKRGPLAQTRS